MNNNSFTKKSCESFEISHENHNHNLNIDEGTKILMKTSHPHYVSYTKLHEKILNGFCTLLTDYGQSTLLRLFLLGVILIPLFYFLFTGNDYAVRWIWFPSVLVLLFFQFVVIPFLTRESVWETLGDGLNNDFYEPAITTAATYQPRPIEEIYYSNGVWKTTSTNQIIQFRGVNLPAKTPTYGNNPDIFYSSKHNVSFIDTPIPLKTAHEHFHRLSCYGFNLVRLVVTWEAVMHENPGVIDYDYLTYLSKLIDIAAQYGIYVIIDPHQDVWSRFTGGDGAPWWTLDVAGFVTEDDRIHQSGGAFVDHLQDPMDPPPKMIWTTNYGKVVTATMFTLFFAGDVYAPGIYVDESYRKKGDDEEQMTMQSFLQKYYLQYFEVVADLVKDKPNVIGFNSMNEPSNGYVGIDDLTKRTYAMPFGFSMNYFDGMRVGYGESLEVQYFSAPFYYHSRKVINPNWLCAWKTPEHDIWQKVGVYEVNHETGELQLNRPDYFSLNGKDFMEEYMVPLFTKIQKIIARHNKKFILYAEPFIDVNDHQCPNAPLSLDNNKYAWAPHWYDGFILMLRSYREWIALDDEKEIPIVTKWWIDSTFERILGNLHKTGNDSLHVVLGEVGVPFDMDPSNQFEASTRALDRTMRAIEANNLDFTLWNYFPSNTIQQGDHWCGEDLSVRMVDRNRALVALIRPYVFKISSDFEIVRQRFDPSKREKKYQLIVKQRDSIVSDGAMNNEICIYLPHFHYRKPLIDTTFGSCERIDKTSQLLTWDCSAIRKQVLKREVVLTIIENAV